MSQPTTCTGCDRRPVEYRSDSGDELCAVCMRENFIYGFHHMADADEDLTTWIEEGFAAAERLPVRPVATPGAHLPGLVGPLARHIPLGSDRDVIVAVVDRHCALLAAEERAWLVAELVPLRFTPLQTLREAYAEAEQHADGEAVTAYCILADAVAAFLRSED